MICLENSQPPNIFHIWGIQLTFVCLWFHMFCKVKNEISECSPSMSTFRLCCKNEKRVKLLVGIYWLVAQVNYHLAINIASRYTYSGSRTKLLPYTNFYIEVLTQFWIKLLHVEVLTKVWIKLLHVEVLTIFPDKTSTLTK